MKGIVQRARSALTGEPAGGDDQADGDLEARVAIAGRARPALHRRVSEDINDGAFVSLGHAEPA